MHPNPSPSQPSETAVPARDAADVAADAATAHACARLILDLARFTDSADYAAALALFSDDATMDRDGEVFSGIDALRQAYARRPADRITRHVLSNIVVQREGADRARVSSYVTVYRHTVAPGAGGPPYRKAGPDVLGQYEDCLVRTAGGWRLASRVTRTVFQFHDSMKG